MKTKLDKEFDFPSLTNLRSLRDEARRRKELKKELDEVTDSIDDYIQKFIKCSLFKLDSLVELDVIIAPDDIHKFTLLDIPFNRFKKIKTPSAIISEILRVKGVEHYMGWFCKTQRKIDPFKSVVFDDSEPCSIFVDFQNKMMFFIPSIVKHIINADHEKNKLVIEYRRTMVFDSYNQSSWNHPVDQIYPFHHRFYMKCTIDMDTLNFKSTEQGW
jgi:hypothetical protein